MLRRYARHGAMATVGLGCTGLVGLAAWDPGVRRQLWFWKTVAPGVLEYRWARWRCSGASQAEKQAEYDALHAKYAPVALDLILNLRGLFIKFGQVCSVRPELVPAAYRQAFRSLQSEVPSEPFSVVREVVEADFACPLESLYASFDEVPCGAASIGQAHRATMIGGEEVVVKVQYPDARWQFMADIASLRQLTAMAAAESLPAYEEFAKQYVAELDYDQERQHLTARAPWVNSARASRGLLGPSSYLCSEPASRDYAIGAQ